MSVSIKLTPEQDQFLYDTCSELSDVDEMTWDTRISEAGSIFYSEFGIELTDILIKSYYFDMWHN